MPDASVDVGLRLLPDALQPPPTTPQPPAQEDVVEQQHAILVQARHVSSSSRSHSLVAVIHTVCLLVGFVSVSISAISANVLLMVV